MSNAPSSGRLATDPAPGPTWDPVIGREIEQARVLEELRSARLVSLTGPGGSGKTRLAESVVAALQERGADAWFVDASTLTDAAALAPTIVASLGLDQPGARDPLRALATFLADHESTLALDNLEQLSGAATVVSAILKACPGVRILTTSRTPLDIRGEVEIAISPLSLPDEDDPESVATSPAAALFITRARTVGYTPALDDDAAHIAAIVRRLDGLPLAIELAAARIRIMSPAELRRRIEDAGVAAIESTQGGPHRSLGAILEWTLQLLSDGELRALEAVAVTSGFDLEFATALITDVSPADALTTLVRLGLVQHVAGGSPTRFRLLETIREEVLRRMAANDLATYRGRHAQAMLDLADRHATRFRSGDATAVADFERDADNFRSALDHLVTEDPTKGLILWHHLHPFWETNTRLREGDDRLRRLAAVAPDPSPPLARAMARHAMNVAAIGGSGRDVATEALRIARAAADAEAEVEALAVLGVAALNDGDQDLAQSVVDDLARATAGGAADPMRSHEVRYFAAAALHGPTSDDALDHLTRAVEAAHGARRPQQEMGMAGNLANVYVHRGDFAAAAIAATRSVDLARQLRNRLLPWSLGWLAMSLAGLGRTSEAVDALTEIAEEALAQGSSLQICDSLLVAMPVALSRGEPLIAARIWGAVEAMVARGDADIPKDDLVLVERTMARVRRQAREIDVELAIRDGAGTDPADLLRSLPERLAGDVLKTPGAATRLRHGDLTKREIEILTLVGQGRSDPEIAEALFISPKTASVHVANIKGKLGVASRLEVALRARDLGLD
jgi:predicted ATPase/DNA-binding CsgD family transcriptional regulator